MIYYSQAEQDKWVCETLNFKKNGFFLDIGAYDGIQTSNTYCLEKDLGWNGICVEANKDIFELLKQQRSCVNLNLAVSDYQGYCNFYNDKINDLGFKTPCDTLNNILKNNNCPTIIDYLSIDIEGHEYTVLKDFNFDEYQINLITIEHNLYLNGPEEKNKIFDLLTKNGFIRVVEDALCKDPNPNYFNQPYEDWYVNSKFSII